MKIKLKRYSNKVIRKSVKIKDLGVIQIVVKKSVVELPILSMENYTFNEKVIVKKRESSKRELHNATELIKKELAGSI